jgi:epoxide hydrolase
MPDIRDFQISLPDSELADLRARIGRTRWPNELAESGWTYGANLAWVKSVAEHWLDTYDWRQWEAKLNAIPNYLVELGGKDLHFMMERDSR